MKYLLSFLFGLFILFANKLNAQGDDCSNAVQLTNLSNYCSSGGTYSNETSTVGGFGIPACWAAGSTVDVWFKFIATYS
jgi:hypothetical protein